MRRRRKKRNGSKLSTALKVVLPVILFSAFVVWLIWPQPPSQIPTATLEGRKQVLNPDLFKGVVREAYMTAKQYPELLEQMKCYCGCDNPMHTPYHRSLYECFTDTHGSNCQVCVDEAILARNLYMEGKAPSEIRTIIDQRYA
ncbi:MAG: CYCXC family (seleno)protein [Nitrososphaerota archaeon]